MHASSPSSSARPTAASTPAGQGQPAAEVSAFELTHVELCSLARVSHGWLQERAAAGLLRRMDAADGGDAGLPSLDAALLMRVRRMRRIERDFDAVPELAALVADLQEEVARLREALAQAQRRRW